MKSLSQRERIMVTLLPGGILLLAYFIFLARPTSEEIKNLRRQVAAAQARVPSPQEQSETLSRLQSLEAEMAEKRRAAQERDERSESLVAFWSDPDAKARAAEYIGNLLAKNRVVLVEEAVASDEDQQAFDALLQPLPSAELWRLRIAGSYDAVRRTVADIGKTDLPLIPAGIEMEPKVQGNQSIHLWNMWICR
ncbi:MAG: hypothetical protein AAGA96_09490 [Verrucomicrobiota bacterium]